MKFAVRYWSSFLPDNFRESDGSHRWVDYSVHPASKLGLHNAMLTAHDRLEILRAHGGQYECAVFVVDDDGAEKLSEETANAMFAALPRGEVKWLDIFDFLLPARVGSLSLSGQNGGEQNSQQLALFDHVHTPYDDLDEKPHGVDVDV